MEDQILRNYSKIGLKDFQKFLQSEFFIVAPNNWAHKLNGLVLRRVIVKLILNFIKKLFEKRFNLVLINMYKYRNINNLK